MLTPPVPDPEDIVEIKVTVSSHNQGWCTNAENGLWAWLDASILRPLEDSSVPETEILASQILTSTLDSPEDFADGFQANGWRLQRLSQDTYSSRIMDVPTTSWYESQDIIWRPISHQSRITRPSRRSPSPGLIEKELRTGDRIAFWIRSQFPGWATYVDNINVDILRSEIVQTTDREVSRRERRPPESNDDLDDPDRALLVNNPGDKFRDKHSRTSSMDKLEQAIVHIQEVVRTTPLDHPERPGRVNELGVRLGDRYSRTGSIDDLEQAIKHAEEVVKATPLDHPDRGMYLNNLGVRLENRSSRTGSMDDLEQAIAHAQEAVRVTAVDYLHRASIQGYLGAMLRNRYKWTGSIDDLEQAIVHGQEAVRAMPVDLLERASILNNLGVMLRDRYNRTGSMDDLEQAIARGQEAVRAIPVTLSERASILNNLGLGLGDRYSRTDSMGDLEQAIEHAEEAVRATPLSHPNRGSMDDLEQAIEHAEEAVRATPLGHPNRGGYLGSLGLRLEDRYSRTGSMDDLEQAIEHAEEAVRATPVGHPNRCIYLNILGLGLRDRYIRTGSMDDLEQAIEHAEEAVKATPPDNPKRVGILDNLGVMFQNRYNRTGSMDDLEQAIAHGQEAFRATPLDHPGRVVNLNNLGLGLGDRYSRTGSMDDLDQAIVHIQEAVKATPVDHPHRGMYLNNLGVRLANRYSRTGSIDDLEQAIKHAEEAVRATPLGHPDRGMYLNNLGNGLENRSSHTGSMDDLEQAIARVQEAVRATPLDHPERVMYIYNLGIRLRNRYSRTGDKQDEESSLKLFVEASKCPISSPSIRINSGRRAIMIFCQRSSWNEAAMIAQTVLDVLPHLCSRFLSRDDQQHAVEQAVGLAADACSLSLRMNDPCQGLQQVEFGRALILGYLMDSRSDISELARSHPDLAKEYEKLRFQAFRMVGILENYAIRQNILQERRSASMLLDACERRIRDQPGFEHFLQRASLSELMQSAEEGPVVIVNCTDISSDAIVVFESSIEHVRLSNMSPRPPRSFQNALERHRAVEQRGYQRDVENDIPYQQDTHVLSWLWSTCVSLVLQKVAEHSVGKVADEASRIWWIGSGAASSLPFHAAGNYGVSGSPENCLSECISSYALSIKSLKHARTIASEASKRFTEEQSLLVVTMPTTPSHGALAGASREEEAIHSVAGKRWAVKSLAYPEASEVLEEIGGASIAHFACHGFADPADPMASHLVLQKEEDGNKCVDPLTVSALLSVNAQAHAWVAYLSACSTAEVKTQTLADESLHLTSAFQMAGFAHVIGSLRPVDDQICAQVARLFYSFLVDNEEGMDLNRAVPEALNYAVRQISKEHPNRPDLWAPFIHLGA
ncbi:hypothetical protein KCV07_g9538, partial [Aureobasidium melanogenum]